MLKFIIEGLLMNNDMSGYDINLYLKDTPILKAGFGNIYPALKKLETKGLIASKEIIEAGKYKKIYSINGKGRKEFLEWLEKPVNFNKSDKEHLIKLFFLHHLSEERAKSFISDLAKQIKVKKRSMEAMNSMMKNSIDHFQGELLFQYYIDLLQFSSEWYHKLLSDLGKKAIKKNNTRQ